SATAEPCRFTPAPEQIRLPGAGVRFRPLRSPALTFCELPPHVSSHRAAGCIPHCSSHTAPVVPKGTGSSNFPRRNAALCHGLEEVARRRSLGVAGKHPSPLVARRSGTGTLPCRNARV